MKLSYRIERDEFDDVGPRDWANLGTMVCWHSRYNLGDVQIGSGHLGDWLSTMLSRQGIERVGVGGNWTDHWYDFIYDLENDYEENISKAFDLLSDKIIILPLYLYDHSGLSMSTSNWQYPFSSRWDTSYVGFIYVSIADAKDEWGWKYLTAKRRERIEGYLRNEVETYDQYLRGDVWGYVIEDDGGYVLDSCWGFYGYDYCESEARTMLDIFVAEQLESNEFERVV